MAASNQKLACFKAYDLRGRVPEELDEALAYRIGRAYCQVLGPKQVVVGHDIRLSSPALSQALMQGLVEGGAKVLFLGPCGTEQVYFATFHLETDGGIMVTASHNPANYNGMKLVRSQSRPISGDSGLFDIEAAAASGAFGPAVAGGSIEPCDLHEAYVQHILTYVDRSALKPLRIVANAGNGGAGMIVDRLEKHLPVEFVKVHHEPDGTFPHGVPNPLLPENREATTQAILQSKAQLGLAWDGDFDRCFLFDEQGRFIEGYYIVGLLAQGMLKRHPGAKIIHDPRLTWNTVDLVKRAGGVPVMSKTGHAFIKERMRAEDAVYGGEMSAHHYFRDFSYCDSGMIPWLLVLEEMCRTGKPLSALIDERTRAYPASGEINRTVEHPAQLIDRIRKHYGPQALHLDETDGVSLEFSDWRFNLRMSNTEPVIRLNVESRGNEQLMHDKTQELLAALKG